MKNNFTITKNLVDLEEEYNRVKEVETPNNFDYSVYDGLPEKSLVALNEIEEKFNCSWAAFMYNRNKSTNSMEKVAIIYRGNSITYSEMYSKVFEYCKSLKALGIKQGDEIPAIISNTPEYVYLRLAASFVGCKLHLMSPKFGTEYLSKAIKDTKSNIVFVTDNYYEKVRDAIKESGVKTTIMFSLFDSLKTDVHGNKVNPYIDLESSFHEFKDFCSEYKMNDETLVTNDEFVRCGEDYIGTIFGNVTLDDLSSITYTSGTTNSGSPKGVKQSNRSYVTFARFKSSDVSEMPEMKNLKGLSIIPAYAHTQLSALSDTLFCNCTWCCEPFLDREFFPFSVMINKPNYCPTTVGNWIYFAKLINTDPRFKKMMFPYLMLPEVVGEELSPGEEKYLNYTSRKHLFGVAKLPFPLAPVKMTIGGGTTEGGGLFTTLFRELQSKKPLYFNKNYSLGLFPLKLAEVDVLDSLTGRSCGINEPGILAVNSPGTLMGYLDESLDEALFIQDCNGKKWLNMSTIAYKADPAGSIKMKGRIGDFCYLSDGQIFYTYKIEEIISKDTKNIMSCTVIKNEDGSYTCHVEKQPTSNKNMTDILRSATMRLNKFLPIEIVEKISFRVRDFYESFPVAASGKRDLAKLKNECNDEILITANSLLPQQIDGNKVLRRVL